jgi:hypothetical protein
LLAVTLIKPKNNNVSQASSFIAIMMAASGAHNIPDEIWQQIFTHFQGTFDDGDDSGYASLITLGLTCRRFQRIAQFSLYHTVVVKNMRVHFTKISEAIIANPKLGNLIRTLTIKDNYFEEDMANSYESFYEFTKDRSNLPANFKKIYESADCPDVVIFNYVIFCHAFMSNLESLHLKFSNTPLLAWVLSGRPDIEFDEDCSLKRMRPTTDEEAPGAAITTNPDAFSNFGFPQLKELRLVSDNADSTDIAELEPILLHPGIEKLCLSRLFWSEVTLTNMQWSEISSSIRVLELNECILDAQGTKNMLQRFPKLQSLTLSYAEVEEFLDNYNADFEDDLAINLDEIGQSLREYGKDLVELSINIHDQSMVGIDGSLGSLRSLHSLRRLSVSAFDLCWRSNEKDSVVADLCESLPRSLQILDLYCTHWRYSSTERPDKIHQEFYEMFASAEFPNIHKARVFGIEMDSEAFKQVI